jgi:hypothetical protein
MKKLIVFGIIAFVIGIGGATGVAVLHSRAASPSLLDSLAESLAGDSIPDADAAGRGPARPAADFAVADGGTAAPDTAGLAGLDAGLAALVAESPADAAGERSAPAAAPDGLSAVAGPTGAPVQDSASEPPLPEGRLAKIFGSMQPRDAARVLEQMDDQDIVVILGMLNDRQAAAVLSNLAPQRAAAVSRLGGQPQRSRQ